MKHLLSFKNLCAAMLIFSSFSVVSCGNNATETTGEDSATTTTTTENAAGFAEAVLSGTNPDTTVTGSARFDEADGKVKMTLTLIAPKMANKNVAVHIHEHGDCGDMGKDAHGHWNPTNAKHGKWGSDNFHHGDIGNVKLDGDGKGTTELETDLWTLGGDSATNILDKAIIVHGGEDDFTSQPAGNAGSRIGCGVIKKG